MTQLTINSVCTKGQVYPMIFDFQNGYPSVDFESKCSIYQDNDRKRTIATEIGQVLYTGDEDTENLKQTLLLVRNRKTGKVRLIETECVMLKPVPDNYLELKRLEPDIIPNDSQSLEKNELEPRTSLQNDLPNLEPSDLGSCLRSPNSPPQLDISELEPKCLREIDVYDKITPNPTERLVISELVCDRMYPSHQDAETSELDSNMLTNPQQIKTIISESNIITSSKAPIETDGVESYKILPSCPQQSDTNKLELNMTINPQETDINRSDSDPRASNLRYIESTSESTIKLCNQKQLVPEPNVLNCQRLDTCKSGANHVTPNKAHHLETRKLEKYIKSNMVINHQQTERRKSESKTMTSNPTQRQKTKELNTIKIGSKALIQKILDNVSDIPTDINEDTDQLSTGMKSNVDLSENRTQIKGENDLYNSTEQESVKHHTFTNTDYSIINIYVSALELNSKVDVKRKRNDVSLNIDFVTNDMKKNPDTAKLILGNNACICDHCSNVFENKGALIFHLFSHKYVNDANNAATDSEIKRNRAVDDVNKGNENENQDICSKTFKNTKTEIKKNHSPKAKSCEINENKKRKRIKTIVEEKDGIILHVATDGLGSNQRKNKKRVGKESEIKNECTENAEEECSIHLTKENKITQDKGPIFHLAAHKFNNKTKEITNIDINDIDAKNSLVDDKNNHKKYDLPHHEINNVSDEKKTAHVIQTYICDYCQRRYERKTWFIAHIVDHQAPNKPNIFNKQTCLACNREFGKKSDLI